MSVNDAIIELIDVSKSYPIRLERKGSIFRPAKESDQKFVLENLYLKVERGEKVGLIGENGAGKTTLLNLFFQRSKPTSGSVKVNGSVQALMQTGIGFSDDLTGRENIRNALAYSEIKPSNFKFVEKDIHGFVELGEFLDLPIKSYSLGMRARLEFAVATAIRPDILLIDEVLGAGDGYFVNKCNQRMQELVSDTTLILVSHSLGQILNYCDRCIWIADGKVRADGITEEVVEKYQEFMASKTFKNTPVQVKEIKQEKSEIAADQCHLFYEKALSNLSFEPSNTDEQITVDFVESNSSLQVIDTGETLKFTIRVRSALDVKIGIVGFSEGGEPIFIFTSKSTFSALNIDDYILQIDKMEIGVGNYSCVPILINDSDEKILAVGDRALVVKCIETNYSDPPIVHLDGVWTEENSQRKSRARISAWI